MPTKIPPPKRPRRRLREAPLVALLLLLGGCGGTGCIEGVPCGGAPSFAEPVPAPVQTAQRFVAVGPGNWHACALTAAGVAWCWGSDEFGQLGASASQRCMSDILPCSPQPLRVAGAPAFASLVAGDRHSCGLTPAGHAWCWGFGQGGQLGDGHAADSAVPVAVAGGHVFRQLAADVYGGLTCGLKADGSLWCWGPGFDGAAGPQRADAPVRWEAAVAVALAAVSIGEAHACGLDAAGAAWCWGRNAFGELGDGSGAPAARAVPVAAGGRFRQISVGPMHGCALAADGRAWCWGLPPAVGDGQASPDIRPLPVPVAGAARFVALHSGAQRSCGLTAEGAAWCWGNGYNGVLGDGGQADRNAPVAVAGGYRFGAVAAGGTMTCGIADGGVAVCWGWNEVGAVGRPIVAH